jgi:2-polyprenyl-3-methyl-5-hydroxy-6-metoxy-1,4-benzoquinol methylase
VYGREYYEGRDSNYGRFGGYGGRLFGISRFLVRRKAFSIIGKHKRSGRMLDLGCAYGHLVNSARSKGFQPTGIDISEYAVSEARKRFPGADIRKMNIEKGIAFREDSFDVVTAMDVLEHCKDPGRVLSNTRKIMKHDGILLVSVPDSGLFPEEGDLDDTHVWHISMKEWEGVFRASGFCVAGTWVFPSWLKGVLPRWCVSMALLRKGP